MKLIQRIAEYPGDVYREIKFGIQRAKKGYSERDAWSFDNWFLATIPNMLRDLEKMEHGYSLIAQHEYYVKHSVEYSIPFEILTGYYGDEDETNEEQIERFNSECSKYWKNTLLRMAELLEEARDAEDKYDDFKESYAVRAACIKEFSEMFSKYFDDLWA